MKKIIALITVLFSLSHVSMASLPAEVDGKPLPTLAPMLEKTTPGVVNIATRGRVSVRNNPLLEDPFFRYFFEMPRQPQERLTQSLGSGVIVDRDKGYVLTNHHVIASADEITVTLNDGRQFDAKLVGTDPESDIAVIQIPNENLTAVSWGASERLRVGDFVVAIGNPFGLGQTVTSGIVSALGRSGLGIEAYEDFIQTDASINPGNSGGALVDLNGALIGINTAIIGPSGGNVGIGFAIPGVMARQIMRQLIEHGEVRRGALGIVVQSLSGSLAKAFDVKDHQGVVLTQVEPGSPADKAGLRAGDVIVEVNGRRVRHADDMRNIIGLQRIGEEIEMKVVRDGSSKSIHAVIEEPERHAVKGKELHARLAGALLGNPDSSMMGSSDALGIMVLDVERGSPVYAAGLRKGDIIVSINRQRVRTIKEGKQLAHLNQNAILLNIQRGGNALFLLLQ